MFGIKIEPFPLKFPVAFGRLGPWKPLRSKRIRRRSNMTPFKSPTATSCCMLLLIGGVCAPACKPSSSSSRTGPATGLLSESIKNQSSLPVRDASDLFFESNEIPKLVLKLAADQEEKLNNDARQYVQCTLIQDGKTQLIDVGLKLKGAAGSFQDLSGKPAFTLNVSKFRKQQSFHAMKKFHLNNSVQDELYTNEWLCSSLCHDAGLPAPRVTHARVWLNDRDLGLYVLKEGFDKEFLKRHFRHPNGNLYDGGFCQDIDVDLERDAGDGPNALNDLRALRDACNEEDPAKRKEKLSQVLDIPAFVTFMAMETMTCHWDGYVSNRNNYRIYFEPTSHRAYFLPHGMDQMFQDIGFQTFGHTPAMVASALRSDPEWNSLFRKRVAELLPLFQADRLAGRVRSLQRKLTKEIKQLNPDGFESYQQQVAEFANRLQERSPIIAQQLTEPDPPPPDPTVDGELSWMELAVGDSAPILDWEPQQQTENAHLKQIDAPEGTAADSENQPVYVIAAGQAEDCIASWRKMVRLRSGRYRLTAQLSVENVVERENDERGRGAGIRISGVARDNALIGSTPWSPVEFEFLCTEEEQGVQLVVELRAKSGTMKMKNSSIMRLEP